MPDAKRPNILIIWGDDIGQSNISAYTKGVMGYRTPHIDRIANEGMIFTDYYAEQRGSCSISWTSSRSPTTPSCSTARTTGPI
jgi:arylsulfatase A-like enzyme